jgi:ankyrin repeat protein
MSHSSSQADIDAFVMSAYTGTLTPQEVKIAVASRGIPVNERHSTWGWTALHWAVRCKRFELVVALLAAGASPNVTDDHSLTSVWWAAYDGTADILQLLIDGGGGGSVNELNGYGITPLIALAGNNCGDAAARLQVLLACSELDLDATYDGKTAEECAMDSGHSQLAVAIAEERVRRERWSALRASWIGVAVTRLLAASYI